MVATSAAHPKTYADFLKTPADSHGYELIDGEIFVSPTPILVHQRVVRRLLLRLDQFVTERDLGEMILSPMDVRLDENIVVQPDLFFVAKNGPAKLQSRGWVTGSPDLVIEVLSPSNPGHDLVLKRELYARYRVPEYWTLNPLKRTLTVLTLKADRYVELRPSNGVATSKVLPEFTLDIADFYEAVYS